MSRACHKCIGPSNSIVVRKENQRNIFWYNCCILLYCFVIFSLVSVGFCWLVLTGSGLNLREPVLEGTHWSLQWKQPHPPHFQRLQQRSTRHLTFHPDNSRHSTHSCNLFGRVKRILSHSIPKNNLTDLTWDTARPPNEALMGENSRHTNLRRTVLRSLQGAWAQHFPNLHIPSRACPAPRLASILQQSLYPTIFWVLLSGSVYSSRTTGKMSRKELQWRPLVTSTFLGQHGSFAGKSLQPLQIAFVRSIFWGMLCACGMHKLCFKALPIENISGVGDGGRMPPMPWMPADLNCNPTHFYHFYLSKRSATISWQFMTTGSARNKQEKYNKSMMFIMISIPNFAWYTENLCDPPGKLHST